MSSASNSFMSWQHWRDRADETEAFVIDGLVHRAATIISGRPMGGKTTLAAAMVGAISRNEPTFLGQSVNSHGPVLVISTDPGEPQVWGQRMDKIQPTHEVAIARYSGGSVWHDVTEEIDRLKPALLIFDNALGAIKGDIRGNEPARELLDRLDDVIARDVAVLLIAHSSVRMHEDDTYTKGPMGSTAYDAWDRLTVHVEDAGRDTKLITSQGNESPRFQISVDLRFDNGHAQWAVNRSDKVESGRPRTAETLETRRTFARDNIVGRAEKTQQLLATALGVPKTNIQRALKATAECKYVDGVWTWNEVELSAQEHES